MSERIVGVIGAGTMGAGIAQIAAAHGWTVRLHDVDPDAAASAITSIAARYDRNVQKGRMSAAERDAAVARLHVADAISAFADAQLVIEAIVERLDVKTTVLRHVLEHVSADAIIATNTSSLSVTELGRAISAAPRTVGMHFFNPAPLLRLVEVIRGAETDGAVADRVAAIATSWDKVVARAADVPGFIVNHVARPYYLEAFRILEDRYATPDAIDRAMTQVAGFRMGPLTLTDLIGQDVNTATSRSVWEQLDHPPLLTPSALQEQLVSEQRVGRKSGLGVYRYDSDPPEVDLEVDVRPLDLDDRTRALLDQFIAGAVETPGSELDNYIVARILTGLITQAELALARGVATAEDIDTALQYGTNYPRGPFAWRDAIGANIVSQWRDAIGVGAPTA